MLAHLAPLCGERSTREARRVRGPLRESEPVETPPHPDLLHSPSQTGVDALMARGATERAVLGAGASTN
jgi:hypothetical protein